MKITEVRLGMISVPLRVPFKTALRSVNSVEDVVVEIHTDTGAVGYGEAPPTGVITGDTTGSIIGAIRDHIAKTIVGRDVDDFEDLMIALNACIQKNTSAKAAVDMALWDLYGQLYRVPVYKLMGGARKSIVTDITISVNDPDEMVRDAQNAIARGYDCLKVKVGKEPEKDIARLSAIRAAVPKETLIRIDANQGWTPKEAVRILNGMQERGLDIEFVEQPVKAHDFDGLKYVTERSYVPVLADESVFSPQDALTIMQMRAADLVNIKLMKCGGLYNALKIATPPCIWPVQSRSSPAWIWTAPCCAARIPSSAARCSTRRRSRSPTSRALASRASSRARSAIWTEFTVKNTPCNNLCCTVYFYAFDLALAGTLASKSYDAQRVWPFTSIPALSV